MFINLLILMLNVLILQMIIELIIIKLTVKFKIDEARNIMGSNYLA